MFAGFGEGGVFGIEAAVEDINKEGGIQVKEYNAKVPVKLIVADCESDPVKRGALAEDMITRDNANFIVGPIIPPPMNSSVAVVAERHKVPFVGGTGPMEPWLGMRNEATPPWTYTWQAGFRIGAPPPEGDWRHGKPGYTIFDIAMAIVDEFGDDTNKVAGVFASDDPDGIGWYENFPPGLEAAGINVIGEEKKLGLFTFATTDFTPMIEEWKKNDVQILWGNCPAFLFGALWQQAAMLDFKPKMVYAARGGLFYTEVQAWGGDLPWGVGCESWWDPSYKDSPGIGGTTPQSLFDRWVAAKKQPLNSNVGWGYMNMQVLKDAIERAGTLNGTAVNKALADTDLMTVCHRVTYNEDQFSAQPIYYFQWEKVNTPAKWRARIVVSQHDFIPTTDEPIWPMPYDKWE
jgi:ABC-type branched-subunit amino acid transport system substrate-binding protein